MFNISFDWLKSATFWHYNTTFEYPGPAQNQGFGPLEYGLLLFGCYSLYVINIEIYCDNPAKFQVKIYMATVLFSRLKLPM